MAEIVNIRLNGAGVESQTYTQKDDLLITNTSIYTEFGDSNDRIECFIYDLNGALLDRQYEYSSYTPGSVINPINQKYGTLEIDPTKDVKSRGYNRGTLNVQYNFLKNLFNSSYGRFYWIKEISQSRKELKLASQFLSNSDILTGYQNYQTLISSLNYYNDFYLNFGNNNHIIAVNVAYTEDADGAYLLIKLYEPLPSDYNEKDQLWIVEKVAESVNYTVDIQVEASRAQEQNVLRGPNINVNINQQVGQTTPYYNYSSLTTTSISSSFQKMMSYYQDRAVEINVDYSDFSNFIHFSSATARINNFVSKLSKLELYGSQIQAQLGYQGGITNPSVSASVVNLQNSIDGVITNFDTYEYYLYYSSGSTAWPKSNSTQPYTLYSVTSSQALAWLGSETTMPTPSGISMLYSASLYDATNKDLLSNVVPQYILDDETNEPYITFVNMVAQHFDNIWIYYKDISNRYKATNNPNTGISLDLVADALIGLGCTLYTNSNISDNLYYSLFGINEDGSLLPPTGSEHIDNYVTSSIATISAKTLQKEVYKRIYHNIPYLYKTKGTRESLNALVNIFGIPKTILTINEFGGYDRNAIDGIDSIYNTKVTGSESVIEISSSLLNPYTTLQYYNNGNRVNSRNVEFGFSPADSINSTITSSLGYFSLDQYIGNPGDQYSASYNTLNAFKDTFFSGYNYAHNIYEYIRLLKYFDNSIFKMAKDYVPARSSLSSGLIIKSHLLERNKYERHEPEVDNSMNYSQSIETVSITATDAPEIPYSTAYNSMTKYTVVAPYISTSSNNVYGPVSMSNNYSWEKYTGEFGGSEIEMVTDEFSQLERSSISSPWTSSAYATQSMYTFYNEGALVNNITNIQPSKEYLDAEYSYGINTPINYANIVSQSSCQTCNRLSCINYKLTSATGSTLYYTYQTCNGTTEYLSLAATSSAYLCAKPETFNFIEPYFYTRITLPSSSYAITALSTCGTTFASEDSCTKLIINATNQFTGSYIKCNGDLKTIYLNAESYSDCVKFPSFNIISTTGSYELIDDGLCYNTCVSTGIVVASSGTARLTYQNCYGRTVTASYVGPGSFDLGCIKSGSVTPIGIGASFTVGDTGPCFKDCLAFEIKNTDASRDIPYYYTDCYGNAITASVSLDAKNYFCMTSGSFSVPSPGGGPPAPLAYSFTTSSFGYCNRATKPCTTLTSILYYPGYYGYIYQKCNGELVSYTSVSDETTTDAINDCIRINTLKLIGSAARAYTGSYCGYYTDLIEYTGSRQYAEVQDYNYHRTSAIKSKYAGAKYTNENPSEDWIFGMTVNPRDYYVDYTGLFTIIDTSSYFPNNLIVKVPYLANISGGIQELNLQNDNWVYFQNIYKPGSTVTLKQFNSTQYSNQKTLDKSYKVVESGYSYQPYYYRSSGSISECFDTEISETLSDSGSTYVKKQFLPGNAILYTPPGWPSYFLGKSQMYKFFPMVPFSGSDFPTGSTGPASGFWEINLWSSGSYGDTYTGNRDMLTPYMSGGLLIPYYSWNAGDDYGTGRFKAGEFYTAPFTGYYTFSSVFVFKKIDFAPPYTESGSFTLDIINAGTGPTSSILSSGFVEGTVLATKTVTVTEGYSDWGTPGKELNLQTVQYLESGSKVFFRLKTNYQRATIEDFDTTGIYIEQGANIECRGVNLDATLCRSLSIYANSLFDSGSVTTSSLSLMKNVNYFFTTASTFNPSYSDYYNSASVLYSTFGDINYPMQPEVGDYIYLYYDGDGLGFPPGDLGITRAYQLRIVKVDINPSTNTQRFHFTPEIDAYINDTTVNKFVKVVFTKRIPDETTIIIQGKKVPGKTSYGFVIPENINPVILKNANTLQSTIQSQILNY